MMADMVLKRHPIRGFIWGILMGAGVTLLLMVFSVIPLSIPSLITYTVVGAVVGALWGSFAPPKKPKGAASAAPPAAMDDTPPPAAMD